MDEYRLISNHQSENALGMLGATCNTSARVRMLAHTTRKLSSSFPPPKHREPERLMHHQPFSKRHYNCQPIGAP
jgi:hypothetical protein